MQEEQIREALDRHWQASAAGDANGMRGGANGLRGSHDVALVKEFDHAL